MKTEDFPVDLLPLNLEEFGEIQSPFDDVFRCMSLDLECAPTCEPSTPYYPPSLTPSQSEAESRASSPRQTKKKKSDNGKQKIPRHKRESHINAEHRRRFKIQVGLARNWQIYEFQKQYVFTKANFMLQRGFDDLSKLVPALSESAAQGTKESKAGMLNKTLDYCYQIRREHRKLQKEADALRLEAQQLSNEINSYQMQLPEGGVSSSPQESNPMRVERMFDDFVRARTFQNWKFWIFAMFVRPIFESYNRSVTLLNFHQSVLSWVEQHCSLISLRPAILSRLRRLSTSSSIMASPEKLPDEALKAAMDEDSVLPSYKHGHS
ncbi:DgyrCDS5937 [Dimorphilus gyrociliatus]|uniref:DgyrCDS5937 n=1 Tax=Dimorphilus gyrociliatus TaxID=2664684 RepID=A0A7I8VM87_9ANNE|nr:DgyrCDS5937 [Dimorphilus gyrociliatus]